MKSIRLRTQGGVTIALEFPERVIQASTAEPFTSWPPRVNDPSHLPENPEFAEFLALLIGNGSSRVLPLDHSLANENRFLRISAGSSVPLNRAVCPFNLAD